jgi:hypothetical protein
MTGAEVGAAATVINKFPEPVTPVALLTERATFNGPAVVGVPVIKPPVVILSPPLGRLEEPKVVASATTWKVKG